MPLLLLIFLMMACLPIPWPEPPFGLGAGESILASATAVLLYLSATALLARRTALRLQREPGRREQIIERYLGWRHVHFFGTLAVFATVLCGLGWGWTVQWLARTETPAGEPSLAPGAEFLALMPFFLMQAGSWFFFYLVAREIHDSGPNPAEPFWGRWGYVLFHFRQSLLLVYAPLVLFLVPQGIFRTYPELERSPWVQYGSPALVPLFLLLMPMAMPLLLGLRPLPHGPLRQRLTAHARRLGFRYRNILLWDTRRGIATAMVVGIVPRVRYVVFTDRLLSDLRDDEVDAVFGHEVGHVRHGHMLFYALFLVLSLLLLKAIYDVVRILGWLAPEQYPDLTMVSPVLFMGSYMFLVFGFLSRRCERQADLFGCRAGSCDNPGCTGHGPDTVLAPRGQGLCPVGVRAFIRALERVEAVNDMTRDHIRWREASARQRLQMVFGFLTGWLSTWQHSTIPKRVAFLRRVADDPTVESRFQRRVWVVKWAITLGLVGLLLTLGAKFGWQILKPGG